MAKGQTGRTAATFETRNPATGEVIETFPVMGESEVRAVVDQARKAARTWAELGPAGRRGPLLRWAAGLARAEDELVELIHAETGKPEIDAQIELLLTLEHIRWAARNAPRVLGTRRVGPGLLMINHSARVEYRPYGVVGVIGPWNYPLFTPAGSLVYALAAGNAVVLKPSELTPAVARFMVDAFAEANPELPEGVFSLVTGFGDTGAALCRAGVDKIAFTGSARTGRQVMAACAESLTPVVLECGGKDPVIVADDADLRAAASHVAWGAMSNAGQTCAGVERVYVTAAVRDAFLAELRKALDGVRPGSGGDAAYGPMTLPAQIDVVRRHIKDALERGGTAMIGGPESVGDTYVEPVVLLDVPEDSLAVREETFGPTVTVTTVANVDEAIRLANDSDYGLGAAVFSRSHGNEIAGRLDAGMVSVNAVLAFVGVPALPFGGSRESGFGRIHGADGLREFSRTRSVAVKLVKLPGLELNSFRRIPVMGQALRWVIRARHGRIGRS